MKLAGTIAMSLAYGKIMNPRAGEIFADAGCNPERFLAVCHLCESPIEQIMLAHLATIELMGFSGCAALHDIQSGEEFPNCPFVVVPQFPIAKFRLDFFVIVVHSDRRAWQFAIECDGIDFHGSLEKRRADYDRDTYLARMGIRTFRYFGQQIYRGDAHPEHDIHEHILSVRSAAAA